MLIRVCCLYRVSTTAQADHNDIVLRLIAFSPLSGIAGSHPSPTSCTVQVPTQ